MGDLISIFGLGGGSVPKNFMAQSRAGQLAKSKNPQRRLRNIDVARFDRKIRQNANTIEGKWKVVNQDGKIETVDVKKRQMADYIKRSKLIGKTEATIKRKLEKEKIFETKDEKGNNIKFKLTGSDRDMKNRRMLEDVVVAERENQSTLSEEDKARNIRARRVSSQMGQEQSVLRDKKSSVSGRSNPLERAQKSTSMDIGAEQASYSIAAQTGKTYSEGDVRGGVSAGSLSAEDSRFAGQGDGAASVAGGFGVNKEKLDKQNDTIKMFQQFSQNNIKKVI